MEFKAAVSVTFGECVETHAGMEQIGTLSDSGFTVAELEAIRDQHPDEIEIVYLHPALPEDCQKGNEAAVLVWRGGLKAMGVDPDMLYKEMTDLTPDKKARMRGRVVNKIARHNLCFADFEQEADYAEGKGTVVPFSSLPLLSRLRGKLATELGEEHAMRLYAELNVYYDLKVCGIGFHGDTERRIVVCGRCGLDNPLEFQWFHKFVPVGDRLHVKLNHGDAYIMSDKAVGWDWKRSSQYTLRHAAGAKKYRTIKTKVAKK